jgi:hypothetical protein
LQYLFSDIAVTGATHRAIPSTLWLFLATQSDLSVKDRGIKMASYTKDRIDAIMYRLQKKATLSDQELGDLQTAVDQLEKLAAEEPHHESHSHTSEHDTQHHGVAFELPEAASKSSRG